VAPPADCAGTAGGCSMKSASVTSEACCELELPDAAGVLVCEPGFDAVVAEEGAVNGGGTSSAVAMLAQPRHAPNAQPQSVRRDHSRRRATVARNARK
jgi:hypothetical protein